MKIEFEQRPWGTFTVLEKAEGFKVKRLEVLPGKRMSYQTHEHRAEHWVIVRGEAKVTIDDVESVAKVGDSVVVPLGAKHRIENPDGKNQLIFIETQIGDYLEEDDILRIEDDFGRAKS